MKNDNLPHTKRRGRLLNGNPSGDFTKAPRCGAKTRSGTPCRSPAMKNGRCRMHGGMSTGPRTKKGKKRARRGNWKHGKYSAEAKQDHRELRAALMWNGRIINYWYKRKLFGWQQKLKNPALDVAEYDKRPLPLPPELRITPPLVVLWEAKNRKRI